MHGLGNDFVVIDAMNQPVSLSREQVRFIADRHFGIGCDQLLIVERSDIEGADFRYRIYNSDGDEVEQCGNGARCFAKFVRDEGLTNKNEIPVVTQQGLITLSIDNDSDNVTVDMGPPILQPEKIPLDFPRQQTTYSVDIEGQAFTFAAVSMGNPHAVIVVEDIETAPVEQLGKVLQANSVFPNSVNVGFMQIIDPEHIKLRVFERGVGETLACGTGACAAVVAGQILGELKEQVDVNLPGGNLSIYWAGEQNPVMMMGPATTVFKGTITL